MNEPIRCPVCDQKIRSFFGLACHVTAKHNLRKWRGIECWCGDFFVMQTNHRRGLKQFSKHLFRVGAENLNVHCVIGALGRKNE